MITKEKFKELVYQMLEVNDFQNKLYDLGIDTINCKYFEAIDRVFAEFMITMFGEDGYDLISWWMYEEVDHCLYEPAKEEDTKEYYFPNEEIPHGKLIADLNKIDDLYDYLTEGGRDAVSEEE